MSVRPYNDGRRGHSPEVTPRLLLAGLGAAAVLLKLLGASLASGFVRFTYDLTAPLVAPFHAIFNTVVSGRSVLEPESVVAIAIYTLIGWGLAVLIRLMTSRPPVAKETDIIQ